MDRMLEVNKVASLMRRCENPKPLVLPSELGSSAAFQRGFLQPVLAEWRGGRRGPVEGMQPSLRLSLAGSAFGFHATDWPDGRPATGALVLTVPIQQGRPLRVSASSGFRIPKPVLHGTRDGQRLSVPGLQAPPVKTRLAVPIAPGSGTPRMLAAARPRPKIRLARMAVPVAPAVRREAESRWLDFTPAPVRYPAAARLATVPFAAPADAPPALVGSKES